MKKKKNSMNSDTSCTTDSSDGEQTFRHAKKCFEKDKLQGISPRPNASGGYWLCCLLPLAFGTVYMTQPACKVTELYVELVLAACGMCLQLLCFFIYAFCKLSLPIDVLLACVPAAVTALLHYYVLANTWWWSIVCGFFITYVYQKVYVRIMQQLPKCFSFGESAIFVQGLVLFMLVAAKNINCDLHKNDNNIFSELARIMLFAFVCLCVLSLLIYRLDWLQTARGFYPLFGAVALIIFCAPITQPMPILLVLNFVLNNQLRRLTVIFYALLVALTVLTVCWQLRHASKANTRIRKIFHLLLVLVYVPGILYECAFIYLASGVALAVFLLLELIRLCNIPPLGAALRAAFATFCDEKDAGILALTPFCLLIGCSLPLWIHPCTCSDKGSTAYNAALLAQFAGVLAVGFGDTAASVLGSKFGKRKWRDSARSVEGTSAFIVAVLLAVFCLNYFGFVVMSQRKWFVTIEATIITALVEAQTDQIDNLVLPLVFYIIVSLG